MYLNLEGAATFILASVKYLRDKSLVSNCYSFNMYQWRLAAIKWKKEAMCSTEVWGLRNNALIALESRYVELLFFQDSCGSLSPWPSLLCSVRGPLLLFVESGWQLKHCLVPHQP